MATKFSYQNATLHDFAVNNSNLILLVQLRSPDNKSYADDVELHFIGVRNMDEVTKFFKTVRNQNQPLDTFTDISTVDYKTWKLALTRAGKLRVNFLHVQEYIHETQLPREAP